MLVRSRRRDARGMIVLRGSGRAVDLRVWYARSGMSPLIRPAFVLFVCSLSLGVYIALFTWGFRGRGLLSRRVFFLFYDFICPRSCILLSLLHLQVLARGLCGDFSFPPNGEKRERGFSSGSQAFGRAASGF